MQFWENKILVVVVIVFVVVVVVSWLIYGKNFFFLLFSHALSLQPNTINRFGEQIIFFRQVRSYSLLFTLPFLTRDRMACL